MAKTVVGLFEDFGTAEKVVQDLINNGFPRENISLAARDQTKGQATSATTAQEGSKAGEHAAAGAGTGAVLGGLAGLLVGLGALAIPGVGPILAAGPLAATLAGAGIGAAAGGLIGALTGAGVPEEDARAYAEGVRSGGTLVMVSTEDARADLAADIMNRYDPVDVDTRYGVKGEAGRTTAESRTATESRRTDQEGERHIPVVEEDMRVGKRQVQTGGVRVHSYVTERPVEQTHQVREENVNVERRPADRRAGQGELDDAFREQTYEVTESREELVTDKEPHVVEDVVIRKDVEEHPETVRDTVRRTDVETENLGTDQTRRTTRDYNAFASDFRNHYQTEYATGGRNYDYYQPAYRYGYDLANNPSYRGRNWSQIEPEARRDWERTHQGSAWDDFKDSIRYAWERATRGMGDTSSYGSEERDQGYTSGTRGRM